MKKFMVMIVASVVFMLLLAPAYAASNQDIDQSAMLIAPKPDGKIGIYTRPNVKQSRLGYGQGGDRVTVLEQVGSNEGYTWDHIRFDESSKSPTEGWIRSDYLSLQASNNSEPMTDQSKTQNYQGSGQSQSYSNKQQNNQGYKSSQQTNYSQNKSAREIVASLKQKVLNLFKKS